MKPTDMTLAALLLLTVSARAQNKQQPIKWTQFGTGTVTCDGINGDRYREGSLWTASCADLPQPMVVPAARVGDTKMVSGDRWMCFDPRRVMLTTENGYKMCVLFPLKGLLIDPAAQQEAKHGN